MHPHPTSKSAEQRESLSDAPSDESDESDMADVEAALVGDVPVKVRGEIGDLDKVQTSQEYVRVQSLGLNRYDRAANSVSIGHDNRRDHASSTFRNSSLVQEDDLDYELNDGVAPQAVSFLDNEVIRRYASRDDIRQILIPFTMRRRERCLPWRERRAGIGDVVFVLPHLRDDFQGDLLMASILEHCVREDEHGIKRPALVVAYFCRREWLLRQVRGAPSKVTDPVTVIRDMKRLESAREGNTLVTTDVHWIFLDSVVCIPTREELDREGIVVSARYFLEVTRRASEDVVRYVLKEY